MKPFYRKNYRTLYYLALIILVLVNPKVSFSQNDRWLKKAYKTDNLEQKIYYCTKSINKHPDKADAYFLRGTTYDSIEKMDSALIDYSSVIKLDSLSGEAFFRRGIVYQKMENYEKAIRDFDKSSALSFGVYFSTRKKALCLFRMNNFDQAKEEYSKCILIDSTAADVYFWRAYSSFILRDFSGALNDMDVYIKLSPDSANGYSLRGVIYALLDQPIDAENDFTHALLLDSTDFNSFSNMGKLFLDRNDYSESRKYYNKALALDTTNLKTLMNIGYTFKAEGDIDNALKIFNKAILLDSMNTNTLLLIAQSYFQKDQKIEALSYYDKIVEIEPENTDIRFSRAMINVELGNYEQVFNDFDIILLNDSLNVSTLSSRALIYKNMKLYNEAIKDYTATLEIIPDLTTSLYNRGLCKIKTGDVYEGIEDLIHYYDLIPYDSFILLDIARAYMNINSYQKAIDYLNLYINNKSEDAQVYAYKALCFKRLGRISEYEKNVKLANEIQPYFFENILNNGFAALETYNLDEAENLFLLCIGLYPQNVDAYIGLCIKNSLDNTPLNIDQYKSKVLLLDTTWRNIDKKLQGLESEEESNFLFFTDILRSIFHE